MRDLRLLFWVFLLGDLFCVCCLGILGGNVWRSVFWSGRLMSDGFHVSIGSLFILVGFVSIFPFALVCFTSTLNIWRCRYPIHVHFMFLVVLRSCRLLGVGGCFWLGCIRLFLGFFSRLLCAFQQ